MRYPRSTRLCKATKVKYGFMFKQREYPKQKWARILGVSRSGYSAWEKTREERAKKEETYFKQVAKVFEEGKGTYGANRICGIMRKRGHKASFYKVRDIMERQGLRCVHCKRRQRSLTTAGSRAEKDIPIWYVEWR